MLTRTSERQTNRLEWHILENTFCYVFLCTIACKISRKTARMKSGRRNSTNVSINPFRRPCAPRAKASCLLRSRPVCFHCLFSTILSNLACGLGAVIHCSLCQNDPARHPRRQAFKLQAPSSKYHPASKLTDASSPLSHPSMPDLVSHKLDNLIVATENRG